MSNRNQVGNNFNAGLRGAAAAVAAGVLALSGCASPNNTEAKPAPATSSAGYSPETAAPTPTPEQSFDPSTKTTEIKIGTDVVDNYYDQLSKIDSGDGGEIMKYDGVLPKYNATLAGDGGDQSTLTMAADGNSYTLSGTSNNTSAKYDVTMTKGTDEKISQVLNVELSNGTRISVISNPSITETYGNAKSWKHLIGKTTEGTDGYSTAPYGIKNLVKQVSEYNPGGTNRVGETVEPSPDISLPVGDYFSNAPIHSSIKNMPATVLVTTEGGNTVGFKVSLFEEAHSSTTNKKVSNISPAEIQKIAPKYEVEVSFKDDSTYPTDDVALYKELETVLNELSATK